MIASKIYLRQWRKLEVILLILLDYYALLLRVIKIWFWINLLKYVLHKSFWKRQQNHKIIHQLNYKKLNRFSQNSQRSWRFMALKLKMLKKQWKIGEIHKRKRRKKIPLITPLKIKNFGKPGWLNTAKIWHRTILSVTSQWIAWTHLSSFVTIWWKKPFLWRKKRTISPRLTRSLSKAWTHSKQNQPWSTLTGGLIFA